MNIQTLEKSTLFAKVCRDVLLYGAWFSGIVYLISQNLDWYKTAVSFVIYGVALQVFWRFLWWFALRNQNVH